MNQEQEKQLNAEINEIIRSRGQFFERNYVPVREAYQIAYEWPELDTLRHEITLAIIFGLCQSAITLTNHLLEALLKHSLIFICTKQEPQKSNGPMIASLINRFRTGFNEYRTQNLSKNIESAFTLGLLSDEERKQLHEFRKEFRNAYSHADTSKVFGDRTITGQAVHIEEGKIIAGQNEMFSIADLPIIQGLAQAFQAQHDAIRYFLYMDKLIRKIRNQLFPSEVNVAG